MILESITCAMGLALAACGSTAAAPSVPRHAPTAAQHHAASPAEAPSAEPPVDLDRPQPPPRLDDLAKVASPRAYCAKLARVSPAAGSVDDQPPQPGCHAFAAWGTRAKPASQLRPGHGFSEVRVLPIISATGDASCALLIETRVGWFASETSIEMCTLYDPGEGTPVHEYRGRTQLHGDYLAITAVHTGEMCGGCDDPIDIRVEQVTLCKLDGAGHPRCTRPIDTIHYATDIRFRTLELVGDTVKLSPWFSGRHDDPRPRELVDPANASTEHYRL